MLLSLRAQSRATHVARARVEQVGSATPRSEAQNDVFYVAITFLPNQTIASSRIDRKFDISAQESEIRA
jgi:hypothetical protein